ncbi:MAG: hypothetical protein EOO92_00905 [Pedobacter sp.]|nr:MAG: hypothetical protein EOO92_00905 [Pedobacter sp.]
MKKLAFGLIAMIVCVSFSCKKDNVGNQEIYGKWRYDAFLADPGDGSGRYRPVEGKIRYLIFKKSGNVEGDAFSEVVSYKILDGNRLEISSKNSPTPTMFFYKVSAKELYLSPQCYEPCGNRFSRVKEL